ncbi:MAG: helix-turn-helix domain-containing protein, partial [Aquirufa sp.]
IPKEKRAIKYQLIYIWILCIIQILWAMALLAVFFQSFTFDNSNRTKTFDYTISFLELNMFLQIVSLLVFPNILYGLKPTEKKQERVKSWLNIDQEDIPQEINQHAKMLFDFIETEKPYLDPKFNKADLSIQLKLSPKEINDVFDYVIKQTFPSYKNTLRVNHAKKLLSEGGGQKLSMDGIGFSSGFASRSSFYSIFKTETGLTPIQYIELLNDKIN